MGRPVSYEGNATASGGGQKIPFNISEKLVYLVNDSATNDVQVNFDRTVGELGTFTIRAGEILSDVPMSCQTISIQGIGASAPVRVMGV